MSGEHYPLLHIPTQVVLTFGRTYVSHCMHLFKDAYLIFCEYVDTLFLSYVKLLTIYLTKYCAKEITASYHRPF